MTRIAPCTALARVTTVLVTAREASTGPTVDGRKPNPGSSRGRFDGMARQETRAYARRVVADVVLTVYINRRRHARCFNRKGLASASRRRETAPARRGLNSLQNCPSTRLRPTASKNFQAQPLTTARLPRFFTIDRATQDGQASNPPPRPRSGREDRRSHEERGRHHPPGVGRVEGASKEPPRNNRPIGAHQSSAQASSLCPSHADISSSYLDRVRRLTRLRFSRWARAGARRRMARSFPWVRPDLAPPRHVFRTLPLPSPPPYASGRISY